MRPIVTDPVAWSVGLSVCHTNEPCKTSEPIGYFDHLLNLKTVILVTDHTKENQINKFIEGDFPRSIPPVTPDITLGAVSPLYRLTSVSSCYRLVLSSNRSQFQFSATHAITRIERAFSHRKLMNVTGCAFRVHRPGGRASTTAFLI